MSAILIMLLRVLCRRASTLVFRLVVLCKRKRAHQIDYYLITLEDASRAAEVSGEMKLEEWPASIVDTGRAGLIPQTTLTEYTDSRVAQLAIFVGVGTGARVITRSALRG